MNQKEILRALEAGHETLNNLIADFPQDHPYWRTLEDMGQAINALRESRPE